MPAAKAALLKVSSEGGEPVQLDGRTTRPSERERPKGNGRRSGRPTPQVEVPFVSLFTGAGGLDLGLEAACRPGGPLRLVTGVAVEYNSHAALTLVAAQEAGYFHRKFSVLGDVRDFSGSAARSVLKTAGMRRGAVELVVGGPPCPSFSTAGKRQSVGDMRGQLVFEFLRIVGELRPRFFLMENVRGLLSAAISHRPLVERGAEAPPLAAEEQLGSALNLILDEMRGLGYQVVYGRVNAANYGAPQLRHRALFFGSRDREFPPAAEISDLMPKTHSDQTEINGHQPWRTLQDALAGLPLTERRKEYQPYSPERARWFEMIPAGANWRHLRDNFSPEVARKALGGAWDADGGRVGFYRRLGWNRPAPTLLTSPTQKATGLCHPEELRPLSVAEYARIQEFPDGYPFSGRVMDKYVQIGNAVPLSLGTAAGSALLRFLA